MICAGVVAAVLLVPASAAAAPVPEVTGGASPTAEHGVDEGAAVPLPPETLNPAIEPAELEIRLVPLTGL